MLKLARWFGAGPSPDTAPRLPDGPLDLTSSLFLFDPYPIYAQLRADTPVAELASGGFLLTRHADITAAFTDDRLGNAPSRFSVLSDKNRSTHTAADLAAHIPPFLDMPAHRLPRQAVSRAFFNTFKAAGPMVAEESARAVSEAGAQFDLVRHVSSPFALRVMSRFVGLDAPLEALKTATQAFFHLFAPISDPAQFATTNAELGKARTLIAAALPSAPEASLIGALRAFQADAPELTDAQIIDNALLVFADGVENIEAGAATILAILTRTPGAMEAVRSGSVPVEAAVREALRLQTPGQIVPRIARTDFELHGIPITEGTPVFLALASGNRDEAAFDAPDAYRPDRNEQALTFGLGRHRCIGEPLGLLQLTELTRALVQAQVMPEHPDARMGYHARFGHRWPRALRCVRP